MYKVEEFPEVHGCFMIYGGQVANASARHRKQEHREVCSVKVAAPVYLDWSDKSITYDQGDHPNCMPSPGKYPLVVDPVTGNARLTKVLMDGGSSLNIIYAETLGLLAGKFLRTVIFPCIYQNAEHSAEVVELSVEDFVAEFYFIFIFIHCHPA